MDETPILALATAAHSGGPAGIDVADDPDFLFIEAELNKLDSLEAQESAKARREDPQPNWFEIEMRAQRLLETKSKDMVVACWFAMALFHRYQYAGLAAGLGLIQEYAANSWDVMFPERARKKKAQIEAMGERFLVGSMTEWFKKSPITEGSPTDEFDALDKAVQRAEAIRDAVTAKMPEDKPDVAKFISALKGFAGLRPKAAAPAPATATTPTGMSTAPPPSGGGGGESFAAPAVADPSSAMTAIYTAVKFLRDADMTNAVPYAVIRAAKWAKVTLPPPGDARTTLPTPEGDLTRHGFMMQGGKWDALLKTAESDFRSNDPLWLDLQRYVCAAMTNLGPPYETAKKTIMSLTGALVARLGPGVFELRFKNGTPLCSGETKLWIETECAVSTGKSSGGGGGSAASNGKLSEAYDKARGMAGSGKLAEALAELNDGLAGCAQRRDRLLWRLRIAQLCADAGKHAVAVPLLEQCQADIERHHVEEWEPAVAAEVAHALYRCRKALLALEKQPTVEAKERLSGAFAWLCRLDPPAALALEPNSN